MLGKPYSEHVENWANMFRKRNGSVKISNIVIGDHAALHETPSTDHTDNDLRNQFTSIDFDKISNVLEKDKFEKHIILNEQSQKKK